MFGRQNSNAEQLTSKFLTSVQVIPANVVSVDYKHVIGLSVKRETTVTIKITKFCEFTGFVSSVSLKADQ